MASLQHDDAAQKWATVITKCFRERILPERVKQAFKELWSTEPIEGVQLIARILMSGVQVTMIDPLIPLYLEMVLEITSVDICSVLIALLAHSKYPIRNATEKITLLNDFAIENILGLLVRHVTTGERPKTAKEARRALEALAEWLAACNAHETVLQMQNEGIRTPEPGVVTLFEMLGTLAISLLSNQVVKEGLRNHLPKGLSEIFPNRAFANSANTLSRVERQASFYLQ